MTFNLKLNLLLPMVVVAAGLLAACANNPGYNSISSPGSVTIPPSEGGAY